MIYFKGGEAAKTLKDLILIGYSLPDRENVDRIYPYFKHTYFDKECTKQQCHAARRSFLDLYEIATTYFPNTTKEELAHLLVNNISDLRAMFCVNIGKVVFVRDNNSNSGMYFYGMTFPGKDTPTTADTVDGTGVSYNMVKQYADNYKQ